MENKKHLIVEAYPSERYIKVNLPDNLEDYTNGNGEGVWAYIVDDKDLEKYKTDVADEEIKVIICNDSVYYPGMIRYGDELTAELRGGKRPIVNFHMLEKLEKEFY